jgi:hypothetical protein
MNLYEIDKAYVEALEMAINSETGEVDEYLMESLQCEYQKKIDNTVCYIKNVEALNEAIDKEIKSLLERKRINNNKVDSLKKYIGTSLRARGYDKYETAKNKLSFRRSTSVVVYDLDKLPDDYIKPKVELVPQKDLIKKAFQNGEIIPGAYLEEKENLQVK